MGKKATIIDVQLATASPLLDLDSKGLTNSIAWGLKGLVAIASAWEDGMLSLYTVIGGTGLQPMHTLTAGLAEEVAFSPDGQYLAYLDQGSDFQMSMNFMLMAMLVNPESEVVIVHLPTQQARRFGSRKGPLGPGFEPRHNRYNISVGDSHLEVRFSGQGRLSWDMDGLLSYGPGAGSAPGAPGPHAPIIMGQTGWTPQVKMPCARLQL